MIGLGVHFQPAPTPVSLPPSGLSTHRTTLAVNASEPPPSPPREVAAALALPSGAEHDAALLAAIEPWILNDPAAASRWIVRLTAARDFDLAAALLVIRTDQLHRSTAVALTWAEDLADPFLRLGALAHVLREWAQADPDAPLRYIERTPALSSRDRDALRTALTPLPAET